MFSAILIDHTKREQALNMVHGWVGKDRATQFELASVAMDSAIAYLQTHKPEDNRYTVKVVNLDTNRVEADMASGMLPETETEYDALENYLSYFLNRDLTQEELTVFKGMSVGTWKSNKLHIVSFCPKDYHDRTKWLELMAERGFEVHEVN